MKKNICLLVAILLSFSILAQKKVTPETRSTLLAIDIPAEAKADKRFVSQLGVDMLIKMKIKPMQLTLKSSEYFFWKNNKIKDARGTTIIDSLIQTLKTNGWTMAFDEKDDTVMWLLKESKPFVLAYITSQNQIDLYIGEVDKAPAVTFQ